MIISVASGKGGTGKTTVSVNMALALEGKQVEFLDCDVEEPNAHLFLEPSISSSEVVSVPVPSIDRERCTFCRKCMDICRFNAIAVVGENVLVFPELCHSCGGCMAVCQEDAVSEVPRELGSIEQGTVNGLGFVHGRMRVGEAMSPPLIKRVRKLSSAEKITIIDAPPGTSCPVIAAVDGVDFVLMVTEPTPFGLHDLKLAVEAIRLLGIPSGLVINRADMGFRDVHDYAAAESLPILMEIPFDRKIAELYSNGKNLVEEMPEWKEKFCQLYSSIEQIITAENGVS